MINAAEAVFWVNDDTHEIIVRPLCPWGACPTKTIRPSGLMVAPGSTLLEPTIADGQPPRTRSVSP